MPTLPRDTMPATPPVSVGATSRGTHSEVLLPVRDEWHPASEHIAGFEEIHLEGQTPK